MGDFGDLWIPAGTAGTTLRYPSPKLPTVGCSGSPCQATLLHTVTPDPSPRPDTATDLPAGTKLLCAGRFHLWSRLGIGSQAETFDAVDRLQGRSVAVKRFSVQGASSWKDVELAEREARVLSTLRHPALPEYVHHFEEDGALYLVMEKVDGQDLGKRLEAGQRFSLDEVLHLLETLANVLSYLHAKMPPVLHRDIKPSNIIQRADGSYALIDFGSVRDGLRPTGGSTVVGTFGFMAPEQFQGRALPATDLYGTGATVLTLLTGSTPDRLPHRGLEIDVRAALPSNIPTPWLELLERLLSADPDKRSIDLGSLLPPLRGTGSAQSRRDERAPIDDAHASRHSAPQDDAHASRHSVPNVDTPFVRSSEWIVGGGTMIPFILLVFLSLLRLALFLVMQVAIPTLLNFLSVFLGRGLKRSATDVAHTGERASRQLSELIEQLSKSGPRVVGRRHRMGPPANPRSHWDMSRSPKRSSGPDSPKRRRMRVGDFDVELPPDPPNSEGPRSHGRRD